MAAARSKQTARLPDLSPAKSQSPGIQFDDSSVTSGPSRRTLSGSSRPSASAGRRSGVTSTIASGDRELSAWGLTEWLVVIVEMCMCFTGNLIRERKFMEGESARRHKTIREIEVYLLFWQGYATAGSILVGVIADCYTGYYYMALTNVFLNTFMTCVLLFEVIISGRLSINPYANTVSYITTFLHVFNCSTGVARLVFGLNTLKTKKHSIVSFYVFFWVIVGGKPVTGGPITLLTRAVFRLNYVPRVFLGTCLCMVCLIIFHYLHKGHSQDREFTTTSRKVMLCFIDSFWSSLTRGHCPVGPRMFKITRHKYTPFTIAKVRDMMFFVIYVLPTSGFSFYLVGRWENVFHHMPDLIYPSGYLDELIGVGETYQLYIVITAVAVYVFGPVIHCLGFKRKFQYEFLVGYAFAVIGLYYMALVAKFYEPLAFSSDIGFVRLFNARNSPVFVSSQDLALSRFNLTLLPRSSVVISFSTSTGNFAMPTSIGVHGSHRFTTLLDVQGKRCVGYVILNPLAIVNVRGRIPLFEGLPGVDSAFHARIFLFSTAINLRSNLFRVSRSRTDELLKIFHLHPGGRWDFLLPEGLYNLKLGTGDELKSITTKFYFKEGGIYGVIVHNDHLKEQFDVDVVFAGKNIPSYVFDAWCFTFGVSCTFGIASLYSMTFKNYPAGLLCFSFGWLFAQEWAGSWILYIGYVTWHEYITASTLFTYSVCMTFLYFVNVFIFVKYSTFYSR